MTQPDNILFVKHGDKYTAEHVNVLANQLKKYYPNSEYFCYTDDAEGVDIACIPVYNKPKLRFWWNKLAMFSKQFPVQGTCLYFDLDMDIKRDPSPFIKWGGLNILDAYWKKDLYMDKHAYDVTINSSIITWTAGEQIIIWEHFMSNRDYFMRKYEGIDRFLVHEKIKYGTHENGIVNSISNSKYDDAPVDMYNGMKYEPRTSI